MTDFYKFTVKWRNEDEQLEVSEGVVRAESFSDACSQLIELAFDDVESVLIEPIGENGCVLLFEEILSYLNHKTETTSTIGPQLREALEEVFAAENE
jgi:hypothetical protein